MRRTFARVGPPALAFAAKAAVVALPTAVVLDGEWLRLYLGVDYPLAARALAGLPFAALIVGAYDEFTTDLASHR